MEVAMRHGSVSSFALLVVMGCGGVTTYALKTGSGPVDFGDAVNAVSYKVGGVAGITTTVTTASLVGKTLTITNGIITGFA